MMRTEYRPDEVIFYKPIYTIREARELLGIDQRALENLIRTGHLDVVRLYPKGSRKIKGTDLAKFVNDLKCCEAEDPNENRIDAEALNRLYAV